MVENRRFAPSFFDVLNALGSVVTISGVSILWLRDNSVIGSVGIWDAIIFALGVSAVLGFASIVVWFMLYFYRNRVAGLHFFIKFSYFSLGVPAALLFFVIVLLTLNKILVLIKWSWFFHA